MQTKNIYRGLPFWSWNGKLEKDEIIRQVHVLKEMGFGGFFMHSRTGLATEYLGKEWFELIRAATEEAEKLGMSAWLYDEDRWPSGTVGGEVSKTLEYQQKAISMYDGDTEPVGDGYIAGELGRFAIKLDCDNNIIDYYKIRKGEQAKDGYVIKKFLIEHMAPQEFYNGYTYIDTMNRAATDAFIKATHELYKEKCGDLFGKTLLGIFTDEPHRGAILNGFGQRNENRFNMMPYTYELFERYKKVCGEDLQEKLPELYYLKQGSKVNRTAYYYVESLEQLFIENFAIPYNEWCKANNLIATGHVLHEDSLAIQTVFSGSVQRYYEHMGYPGVDILTENNRAYYVAKQVQSVARQMGQPFVLSELYGCTGWQMNFRSHRDVGAWQTLLGINMRCHHLSWYTMKGEAKRDYPASIFYQSGWYKDYSYVEDYFARLGEVTSTGDALCSTLVINPVESMWMYIRSEWQNEFALKYPETFRLEENYLKLFKILTTGQVDFDYGDEDILKRHYKIEVVNGKTTLIVGKSKYTTVVVSGLDTIRSTTVKMLEEFVNAGGDVVFAGDIPQYIDVQKAQIPLSLLNKCAKIDLERDQVLQYLKKQRFFEINSAEIITTVRKDNDKYYLVCLNEDRNNAKENLTLKLNEEYNIEEIKMDADEEFGIAENVKGLPVNFAAGECRVFRVFKGGKILAKQKIEKAKKSITLKGPFEYELNEKNILPLDLATYSLDGVENTEENEILQIDRKIREKLGFAYRGGEMIQPWFREKYGFAKTNANANEICLKYRFNVEHIPEKDMTFVIEQGARWTIKVNNKTLDGTIVGHWIDTCFDEYALPAAMLKKGENEITISAKYDDTLNLECVYIMGEFGVFVNGKNAAIGKLPETLNIGDVTNQGLPFYSGTITYKTKIGRERVSVKLADCFGAVSKVYGKDYSEYIAFAPYKSKVFDCDGELKIDVVLTRRNTFGPLHFAPIYAETYHPDTFIVTGGLYTSNYCLIPQGLLNEPEIEIY